MPSKKRKWSRNEEGKDVGEILAGGENIQEEEPARKPTGGGAQRTHLNEKAIHNGHYSG